MEGEMSGIVVMGAVIAGFLLVVSGMVVGYLQLKQIHSAVNSNMTTALNKIDELHQRLEGLPYELETHTGKKVTKRKQPAKPTRRN